MTSRSTSSKAKSSGSEAAPQPSVPGLQQQVSSWRSSLYEEPTWVSVAWIAFPVAVAVAAIFFAMR